MAYDKDLLKSNDPQPPPPAPNDSQRYSDTTTVDKGNFQGWAPTPPRGEMGVDTTTLSLFADYLATLGTSVAQHHDDLEGVQVEPGAFFAANQMRTTINGAGSGPGLKGQYQVVFQELGNALTDLSVGLSTLSQKYATTEELNKVTAQDLKDAMARGTTEFGSLLGSLPKGGGGTTPPSTGGS